MCQQPHLVASHVTAVRPYAALQNMTYLMHLSVSTLSNWVLKTMILFLSCCFLTRPQCLPRIVPL